MRVFGYERLPSEEPSRSDALDRLIKSYVDVSAWADRKLLVGASHNPGGKIADSAVVRRAEADPLA